MASGRSPNGRGGSQIVNGGSSTGRGTMGEKDEAAKVRTDAACLRGSYRYTKYGLTPPPVFSCREASSVSRRVASASCSSSSTSSLRAAPPRVKMEIDDAVEPGFAPSDYVAYMDVGKVAAQLEEKSAGFASGDFVNDMHLPTVPSLVSETSRRDAEKVEEWHRVRQEQQKVYVDLDSDEE